MEIKKRNLIKEIDRLSEEQIDNLIEYIQYHFKVHEVDPEIAEAKNKIYFIYKQSIAPVVNKIEVYEHRFPIDAYAGIESIFRYMSSIEHLPKDDALLLYTDLERFAINQKTQLSVRLIKTYMKLIKNYKRILSKFNYTGICPVFKKEVNLTLKEIRKNLRVGLNLYKKRYKKEKTEIDYSYKMDVNVVKEQNALNEALNASELLMEYCENNYSNIISSQYSSTFFDKLFPVVSVIFTIIFAVVGVIGLINLLC